MPDTRLNNIDYRDGYAAGLNAAWFALQKLIQQGDLPQDQALERSGIVKSAAVIVELIQSVEPKKTGV